MVEQESGGVGILQVQVEMIIPLPGGQSAVVRQPYPLQRHGRTAPARTAGEKIFVEFVLPQEIAVLFGQADAAFRKIVFPPEQMGSERLFVPRFQRPDEFGGQVLPPLAGVQGAHAERVFPAPFPLREGERGGISLRIGNALFKSLPPRSAENAAGRIAERS